MVETAAELFRQQGYGATSWRQVVAVSGAPAGSIGHHFPGGKEQLAVEVVASVSAATRDQVSALLGSDDAPVTMMRRWIRASAHLLEATDYASGCPLATIALELAHSSDPVQSEIAAGYDSWSDLLASRLKPTHGEAAAEIAELLLAAFEGALLLSRARRSTGPLGLLDRRLPDLLNLAASEPSQ